MLSFIKSLGSLLLLIVLPFSLHAQTSDSHVVGTVGEQQITYSELLQNYSANTNSQITYEELQDFLPVYLDYRAKLLAGRDQGYFQDSALVAEHKEYTKQAAYSFWLQNEIKRSAFKQFKYRSGLELKSFHILIALGANASESEANEVIAKLRNAKSEIESGTPLEEVNETYSTVRNNRSMGGDLPWITAGVTVKDFEDQLYALDVNEVSEPFRTQFGYHIVLLQDKRERVPSRLVKHIYVSQKNDSSDQQKISEAYQALQDGRSWEETVRNYSEDRPSVQNAGAIGWFNYQSRYASMVEPIMNMNPEVSYSEPTKTDYGYHIFRIDSVQSYPSEAAKDEALKGQLEETSYFEASNTFILNYLEEKFERPILEDELIDLTIEHYPEFEKESESYFNGLVVFKLNDHQIWSTATVDSTRLHKIYQENIEEYQYPDRPYYYLITARHDSTLEKAVDFVNSGGSPDSLRSNFTRLSVNSDSTNVPLDEPFTKLSEMDTQSFSDMFDYNNRRGIFWLEEELDARTMTFDEAFNRLITEFQPQREQEWIDHLREKYNVTPDFESLQKAYRESSMEDS